MDSRFLYRSKWKEGFIRNGNKNKHGDCYVVSTFLLHWRIIGYSDNSLFDWPVAEPGHRGNPGLIQPVVSQRNYVQTLGLIENCLWDFLNQVVLQVQLLNNSQSRKQEPNVWYHARWQETHGLLLGWNWSQSVIRFYFLMKTIVGGYDFVI